MKIALIVPGFSAGESDWCIPALLDFVRVVAARDEMHVFALRYPHRVDRYAVYGATVHSLNGVGAGGLGSPALWARAVRAVAAEHRRGRFDVLHAFWAYEPGPVAAWAGRRLGVPVVTSLAGGELARMPRLGYGLQLSPHRRLLIRLALRSAQATTAGSVYLQHMAQSMGRQTVRAPLGVDTAMFSASTETRLPKENGFLDILHVGSLMPVKGHEELIEAFGIASREAPGLRLRLAGADTSHLRPALEGQIAGLGLAGRVEFLGEVPHEALPGLYRSSDCLIQSSWHEAQGMAVLEAAACSVPAVGTRVGILAEIMPEEWLAPPGDVNALAALLVRIAQRPQALPELGRALRARVEPGLSVEVCAERLRGVYLKAIDRT